MFDAASGRKASNTWPLLPFRWQPAAKQNPNKLSATVKRRPLPHTTPYFAEALENPVSDPKPRKSKKSRETSVTGLGLQGFMYKHEYIIMLIWKVRCSGLGFRA